MMLRQRHPLSLSLALHLCLLGAVGLLSFKWDFARPKKKVDFEVIEYPKATTMTLKIETPKEKIKPPEPQKSVFGVSRKAITADAGAANAPEIKQGNTVAKAEDHLKLEKDDPDSLPIPTDDYMVSQMPKLKSEVRIPYPEEAKKASIEGPVVMDLLIDAEGRVRKVDLIKGPGYGLNEAAVGAVQKFEFIPARMADHSVAVKIRYTYRFILENR